MLTYSELLFLILYCLSLVFSQGFWECHDDPTFEPDEGPLEEFQFSWLGALQYIHEMLTVKNGTPHYFRVPRVVLVSRQFVLCTAIDAARLPEDYALGNVIFGDYERDEAECKLSVYQLANGADCDPAVLLMPIADVLLHPEYVHFGVKSSVALIKLLKSIVSAYVVPVCLPFRNYLDDKGRNAKRTKIYHIDFSTDVPRDFIREEKEVTVIKIVPQEICYAYTEAMNQSKSLRQRLTCTTGCGYHSGAPSVVHEHTGHWTIFSISEGGAPCPDPLVARSPATPPRHIQVSSYVPWITAAISGRPLASFAKDDPFGYVMPRAGMTQYDNFGHGWNGHWWMGGIRCWDRDEKASDLFRFYHEIFQIKPTTRTMLTYYLEIDAAHETTIICVKVGMPYRMGHPKVWELDTPMVKVQIPVLYFISKYAIQVEAFAYNTTETAESSSSSESSDSN